LAHLNSFEQSLRQRLDIKSNPYFLPQILQSKFNVGSYPNDINLTSLIRYSRAELLIYQAISSPSFDNIVHMLAHLLPDNPIQDLTFPFQHLLENSLLNHAILKQDIFILQTFNRVYLYSTYKNTQNSNSFSSLTSSLKKLIEGDIYFSYQKKF
jgi:hypothetical protein